MTQTTRALYLRSEKNMGLYFSRLHVNMWTPRVRYIDFNFSKLQASREQTFTIPCVRNQTDKFDMFSLLHEAQYRYMWTDTRITVHVCVRGLPYKNFKFPLRAPLVSDSNPGNIVTRINNSSIF